jgi:opacity protein-like surface antigen
MEVDISKELIMKRLAILTAVLCLVLVPAVGAQVDKAVGTLGFGVDGGLLIPASGDVTKDSSLSDVFKTGPVFGAHVNYTLMKEVTVRGGFAYAFMKMKDEARGDRTGEPFFTTPYLYVDGILNCGPFIKPGGIINPYVVAGGGVYMWKVTDDGAGGDAILLENKEEFKKTSFGLHFGAGAEVYATPALSIYAEGKYHMLFTEDTDKFSDDFGNAGAIDVSVGLTYHLPL